MKNRLKQLRTEKGLTLDDIQKQTGINRATYNNYESGKTEPKLETWMNLSSFFNVPLAYLQGRSDVKNPISDRNKLLHGLTELNKEEVFKLLNQSFDVMFENNQVAEYFKISNAVLNDSNDPSYKYLKELESNITDISKLKTFVYLIDEILDMFLRANNKTDQDSVNAYKKLEKLVDEYTQANHSQLNDKSSKK